MADPNPSLIADGNWQAAERENQVQRIVASAIFRNSPLLQSFLRFVADCALHGREAEINEYLIATQVFARKSGFDPAADTIVRTQAYRLRSKLQQYYSTVGIGDLVVIEIPKGHYVPVFRRNNRAAEATEPRKTVLVGSAPIVVSRRWRRTGLVGAALAALLGVFFLGWLAGYRKKAPEPAGLAKPALTPVEALWLSFLETDKQPIVAFTNGQFLGTETGDLLQFSGGPVGDRGTPMKIPPVGFKRSQRLYFEDDYTGVGEVLAAVLISNTLWPLTGPLPFKRSRLVTADDLHHHNLIFLGSPRVNPILNDLGQPQNFVFHSARTPPLLWHSQFENVHPASGESPSYRLERDPASGALRTDYATITLMPGVAPGRKIMVLAGLTTSGTQGAAESVTTLHGVTELAGRLGVANSSDPKKWPEAFQTLLRVELSRGLDVIRSQPVAARVTK